MDLYNLDKHTLLIWTDFSAQLDLEPIRKVNCHVNKHAVLGVFCCFYKESITLSNGKEIEIIQSHDWFVTGECEEKGKQNDWIFHRAALDYIADYYKNEQPQLDRLHMWTDNCPGQVSVTF